MPLRVAVGADGVSIWSSDIFGGAEPSRVRDFLSRAFSVEEVARVELRRARSFGRIHYDAVGNPAQIWKKLSRVLSAPPDALSTGAAAARPGRVDAGAVYLGGHAAAPLRIQRVGDVLSTWQVRQQGEGTLRLWHPVLRRRRDVVFRLEEELAAILGIEGYRANALTAAVSIRFDRTATTAERITRELEKAWPRLLGGLDGPPSAKRLVAAVGLSGLAFTGQYLAPAVRPFAVAGMTLYSLPNVVSAAKQLTRREVGLSALYSTGVAFMLISGMPFTASVMAVFMQSWPHLAGRKLVSSQRRLFAAQRQRPAWSRVQHGEGVEIEVHVDDLRKGDRVVVRGGEVIPVDGVVEGGSAAVIAGAPLIRNHFEDKSPGDAVAAGAFVRDGSLTIRVERTGAETSASYVASLLPRAAIPGLPSSLEAERIANRNAKPALTLSFLSLLLTRSLRPSQAVIRPDFATAPRLSAQLSALQGLAHGLERGVLFRNPGALDRLASAQVYVIDDSAGLERRRVQVAAVQTADGVPAALVVGYAAAAHRKARSERSRALSAFASRHKALHPNPAAVRRQAGVTRYRDHGGHEIEIATSRYLAESHIVVPRRFESGLGQGPEPHAGAAAESHAGAAAESHAEPSLAPLWVLRDGEVIGAVSFARTGEIRARHVVAALRAQNRKARLVYVSHKGQADTQRLARALGIDVAHGGLSPAQKVELIRGLGGHTLWVGNGSEPDARESIAASSVSVSVAPLSQEDAADILLPDEGISRLPDVIDLGRAHAGRLARDYRTVYGANLVGVAGAFIASFSSMQSGLLSNVGTGLIYARHARALDRLAAAADARRARLTASVFR